jgi:hypothetical protein
MNRILVEFTSIPLRVRGTKIMNKMTVFRLVCASVLLCMSSAPNATLIDRGNGLIYDDVENLTWLQDAGLSGSLKWSDAMAWADNLVFGGFDDWRLPTTTRFDDPTCSSDARGSLFYEHRTGCTGGEMEMLTNLYDPWTNDLFHNVNSTRYWTATPYRDGIDPCINYPNYDVACNLPNDNGIRNNFYWQWAFTGDGSINVPYKTTLAGGNSRYAWAVRNGDVLASVPSPAAIYLFVSGLFGLFGIMKRKAV